EDVGEHLPAGMKNIIAGKKLKFYVIDAVKIASELGLGSRINMIMMAAFFKLANVIDYADAERYMKEAVQKSYGKKGEKVVAMNNAAIDNAISNLKEVQYPECWATTTEGVPMNHVKGDAYTNDVISPILHQEGNKLPVSKFDPAGRVPTGTAKYEKRGIAVKVPHWIIENCIQCNQCSLVCPHAVIRPALIAAGEETPAGFETKPAIGKAFSGYQYRIQVSPLDCTGCGNCADVCPAKNKALVMEPLESQLDEQPKFDFVATRKQPDVALNTTTVKDSQFLQPLFEFSGACAGCGETPYVKLITQLFGDRMVIANATGCSSIYGGSAPTVPYTVNSKGHGPAWANSLFEDNAEFGFGMCLSINQRRNYVASALEKLVESEKSSEALKAACNDWLANKDSAEGSKKASQALRAAVADIPEGACELVDAVKQNDDMLVKKSIWILGGDGWAYDIGYGGLDHVLAMGEDVNILVMDTEVYSNTGGQSSKATPTGSVAKFAAAGKRTRKKDLGMMAMSYGYVYVASVAMGANQSQLLKAVNEAESYNGPSLIIAYSPCINHGINMGKSQAEAKKAVETGYWPLYRFNPTLADEGKNPFVLDSKAPTGNYGDFLAGETRYKTLTQEFPETAEHLFAKAEAEAKKRLETYQKLAEETIL
ncbi:MAG: pyruvate:ferredoxin (flavodoxin) oxidoreductase, partial [Eubacteriales bacterium]|nr:pyruvate:ferredoxin (flavodoxin) oxidoreductase [Eubacteriales bacterium]